MNANANMNTTVSKAIEPILAEFARQTESELDAFLESQPDPKSVQNNDLHALCDVVRKHRDSKLEALNVASASCYETRSQIVQYERDKFNNKYTPCAWTLMIASDNPLFPYSFVNTILKKKLIVQYQHTLLEEALSKLTSTSAENFDVPISTSTTQTIPDIHLVYESGKHWWGKYWLASIDRTKDEITRFEITQRVAIELFMSLQDDGEKIENEPLKWRVTSSHYFNKRHYFIENRGIDKYIPIVLGKTGLNEALTAVQSRTEPFNITLSMPNSMGKKLSRPHTHTPCWVNIEFDGKDYFIVQKYTHTDEWSVKTRIGLNDLEWVINTLLTVKETDM